MNPDVVSACGGDIGEGRRRRRRRRRRSLEWFGAHFCAHLSNKIIACRLAVSFLILWLGWNAVFWFCVRSKSRDLHFEMYEAVLLLPSISMSRKRLNAIHDREDRVCPICLDVNPDVITGCKHSYHDACIRDFIRIRPSASCPLCRGVLRLRELKKIETRSRQPDRKAVLDLIFVVKDYVRMMAASGQLRDLKEIPGQLEQWQRELLKLE